MKKAAILTLSILTSLTTVSSVYADTHVSVTTDTQSSNHSEYSSNSSGSIHIQSNGGGDNEVKINNSNFEITGKITSVSGNDFQINGQKVTKDSSVKISGDMSVGKNAHIKGYIKSTILYATEINITDSGSSSSPSSLPTNTPSSNPSSNPSSSASASPTVLGVKTSPTENLQGFLTQLFSFFRNLFK